jgi:hypothetical protein
MLMHNLILVVLCLLAVAPICYFLFHLGIKIGSGQKRSAEAANALENQAFPDLVYMDDDTQVIVPASIAFSKSALPKYGEMISRNAKPGLSIIKQHPALEPYQKLRETGNQNIFDEQSFVAQMDPPTKESTYLDVCRRLTGMSNQAGPLGCPARQQHPRLSDALVEDIASELVGYKPDIFLHVVLRQIFRLIPLQKRIDSLLRDGLDGLNQDIQLPV